MGNIERIEAEVRALSAEELAAFREWFREFDEGVWDEKIEADVRSGKLDALAEEALGAQRVGNKPVAELPDLLGSLPKLSETEAEEFAQDVVSARSELDTMKVRDSLAHRLTMVTGNVREFARVPGLEVESWVGERKD